MGLKSFRKGIHPPYHKHPTAAAKIVDIPIPPILEIPLSQHTGTPAKAVGQKGDAVGAGELIGARQGFISANIHSPVFGEIKKIAPKPLPGGRLCDFITIETDLEKTAGHAWPETGALPARLDRDKLADKISAAGIAGLGGAAFPTHVKFSSQVPKASDVFIINGAECEPYLTCDHRVMVENTREILKGVDLIAETGAFRRIVIGIEANKPDAIAAFNGLNQEFRRLPLEIIPLKVKYPQGAEKMLIKAVTGRTVPSGGLPLDIGVTVSNVQTVYAVYEAVYRNKPLIERVLTVTGNGIKEPRNIRALIGTPLNFIARFCGGLNSKTASVISGGPMMGTALPSLDYPVTKGSSGYLLLTDEDLPEEQPCIRCGRCADACPVNLAPLKLAALSKARDWDEIVNWNVNDCIECGACAYSCPAFIRLVSWIRFAKQTLRQRKQSSA